MDKRWIIIFVIFIIGMSSLYVISTESVKVGSAITSISNVIVNLPDGFRVTDDGGSFSDLASRNNDEKIHIDLIKQKNKAKELEEEKIQELKSDNVIDIENSTETVSGITVYSIKYQNLTPDTPVNYTVNYFNKLNKTLSLIHI